MDGRCQEESPKKKLVQINTVCNTSTGRIMGNIQREAIRQGYDAVSFVGRRKVFEDVPCEKFGNPFSFWLHVAWNTAFDRQGYASWFHTRRLVSRLREIQPDIIHLHNLHGYYLNLPVLFRYLNEEFTGKLFWTFHDCWPFTGHCPHYVMAGCDKWILGCHHCPNKKVYPISFFLDASSKNYEDKKKMFSHLEKLTVIVPSEWMAAQVRQSFFRGYPLKVISNGIDLKLFSYRPDSRVFGKYHIPQDKKVLLGVANIWEHRKGFEDFMQLAADLSDDYRIVMVGVSKRQLKMLPGNVIGIERTGDQKELAALYSVAEIFINPSLEESFSLVTVEAFACGTPVIVLDTSAVAELVTPDNGIVLHEHESADYLRAIERIETMRLDRKKVAQTARKYDVDKINAEIVALYKE